MVSRSCRRFGLRVGKVLVLSATEVESMFKDGKDYCYITKQLFNKFDYITKADIRKEIISVLGSNNPNQRTRRDKMREQSFNVYCLGGSRPGENMPKFKNVRRELREETQLGTITENSQILTCEELETSTVPEYNANVCETLLQSTQTTKSGR